MHILHFHYDRKNHPRPIEFRIPNGLYKKIHASMPIACVDLVIKHKNKFLLVKRANNPCKNQWFIPGGRLIKNETLEKMAQKKMLEETGLTGNKPRLILIAEHFDVGGYFPKIKSHMLSFIFLIEIKKIKPTRLDSQSSAARWFSKIPRNLHPYPKSVLEAVGFKK